VQVVASAKNYKMLLKQLYLEFGFTRILSWYLMTRSDHLIAKKAVYIYIYIYISLFYFGDLNAS